LRWKPGLGFEAAYEFGLTACVQAGELSRAGCRCIRALHDVHSQLRCEKLTCRESRIGDLGLQVLPRVENRRGKDCHGETTWATTSMVHVPPSRMPEPPPVILVPVCTPRLVAWSAGTMPTIVAPSTLSTPAYKTAPVESWNDSQKGSSAAICSVAVST
jgi:hypothetical protein